ncbi:hypothetical protein VTK56DRAFT_6395 [Thermocarpiscus australiensis]
MKYSACQSEVQGTKLQHTTYEPRMQRGHAKFLFNKKSRSNAISQADFRLLRDWLSERHSVPISAERAKPASRHRPLDDRTLSPSDARNQAAPTAIAHSHPLPTMNLNQEKTGIPALVTSPISVKKADFSPVHHLDAVSPVSSHSTFTPPLF